MQNFRPSRNMGIDLDENGDLLPHYDLDYSKAKPNRFAEAYKKSVTIRILRKDVEGDSAETVANRQSE